MSIALILPGRNMAALRAAIKARDSAVTVQCWPELETGAVRLAVAWQQPPDALARMLRLEAVLSFGAGVDGLLQDKSLPERVALGRIVYPGLVGQMGEYLAAVVLARHRRLRDYAADQRARRWRPRSAPSTATVGILGLGELGRFAAQRFHQMGFRVLGWSRKPKILKGVTSLTGANGLQRIAQEADFLLCLLPLTPATRGILNAGLFQFCKRDAFLVNAGRGDHLVESHLIQALDEGRLSGACLDVFQDEPLPGDHPFWAHPRIHITPHVASVTDNDAAAACIVEDYRRLGAGKPLQHPVDRERGY